jgi:putative acetyltransferase
MRAMVELRRARAEDDAAIRAVHASAVRVTCRSHYDVAQVEAWALRFEPDRAGGDVLVATDDGRIVGFAALAVETEEVRAVYVHPDAGRLGTGARLLAALERIAGLRGLHALRLEASLNAVAFYAAAGWTRWRDTLRTFPGGCDIPCVAMTKTLPALRLAIRGETGADVDRVRAVEAAAFERPAEAQLVDRLRDAGALAISLVATLDDDVVGHVALSPVSIDGAHGAVLGLGPMAVSPPYQSCAVGGRLVEEALALARERGHPGVVVLGHPEYYPRFGFVPASRFAIRYPAPVPDEAFLAAELAVDGLAEVRGAVRYHGAFDAVE